MNTPDADTATIPPELGHLPVAVVGAGPIGLAAAAHLAARSLDFVVLESGAGPGSGIRDWGHVRLFSPWSELIDPVAADLLATTAWKAPSVDGPLPTGHEYVRRYLEPLAAHPAIAPHIRYSSTVTSIHRRAHDKVKSPGRSVDPFALRVEGMAGDMTLLASAVIDASGTYTNPNPAGAGGVPAPGEDQIAGRIGYRIPDMDGADRPDLAGRHVLVVGSGHSAVNAILDLLALSRTEPGTRVTWALRGSMPDRVLGSTGDDRLPARESLGARLRDSVDAGDVEVMTGFAVDRIEAAGDGVRVSSVDGRALVADRMLALTGQRPDLALTRELRLDLDPWLEAPRTLAPLIDPNVHTCGTVEPHGYETLRHPEPGYFAVGIKSYGRAPTFLVLTGFEQVRSVVAALAGDHDTARRILLDLPRAGESATSAAGLTSVPAEVACCA